MDDLFTRRKKKHFLINLARCHNEASDICESLNQVRRRDLHHKVKHFHFHVGLNPLKEHMNITNNNCIMSEMTSL